MGRKPSRKLGNCVLKSVHILTLNVGQDVTQFLNWHVFQNNFIAALPAKERRRNWVVECDFTHRRTWRSFSNGVCDVLFSSLEVNRATNVGHLFLKLDRKSVV